MRELRSKCCGAKVSLAEEDFCGDGCIVIKIPYYECFKCGKPTEVKENNDQNEQFLDEGPSRAEEGDK